MKDKLIIQALDDIVEELPKEIKQFVIDNAFIAGGAIHSMVNGLKINDYDFYFKTKKAIDDFKDLIKLSYKYKVTKFAINLSIPERVQFVTKFYGSPEEILTKFDFKHCMAYYDLSTKKLVNDRRITESTHLEYNIKCSYPIKSIERMLKCIKDKKMTISGETLVKMAVAINSLDLSTNASMIDHFTGLYGKSYVDPQEMKNYQAFLKHNRFSNKLDNILNEE